PRGLHADQGGRGLPRPDGGEHPRLLLRGAAHRPAPPQPRAAHRARPEAHRRLRRGDEGGARRRGRARPRRGTRLHRPRRDPAAARAGAAEPHVGGGPADRRLRAVGARRPVPRGHRRDQHPDAPRRAALPAAELQGPDLHAGRTGGRARTVARRRERALCPRNRTWGGDLLTDDYVPGVHADQYREVTVATSTPTHTGEQNYLRQNFKDLISTQAVRVVGPDPCDVGGIAELKWV